MKLKVSQLRAIIKEEVRSATVNRRLEEAIERELQALVAEGLLDKESLDEGRMKNLLLSLMMAAGMSGGLAHNVNSEPAAEAQMADVLQGAQDTRTAELRYDWLRHQNDKLAEEWNNSFKEYKSGKMSEKEWEKKNEEITQKILKSGRDSHAAFRTFKTLEKSK